jgi:hypothetical protein
MMAHAIRIAAGMLALAASGCAHHRLQRGGETITYATTRCMGSCPAYTVTLGPDGQGIFTSEFNAGPPGDHRFLASPAEVRGFTAALDKVRPKGERLVKPGQRGCGATATDQASIDISWQGVDGAAHLRLYLGCQGGKARGLRAALQGLPITHLPLQDYLGAD